MASDDLTVTRTASTAPNQCAAHPAGGDTEAVPPETDHTDAWRGSGLVLVVEDENQVLRFTTTMLSALGFEVVAAIDAVQALDALRRHRDGLALVLLDVTVPGMTGEDFLAEMERTAAPMPVVLSSGHDKDDLAVRFAGRRVAGVLQKPYRLAELRATLRHVLAGQQRGR
jgi:two-component system cell cycle sensor histidine kinase/response regulator CckA